jgi:hypothetical protein
MHFIDIIVRDENTVLHKETAQVPDGFAGELVEAYRTYYPDAVGDTQMFQRISRGLIEGIMANIASARAAAAMSRSAPRTFRLESEPELPPEPEPEPEPPPPIPDEPSPPPEPADEPAQP